MNAFSSQTYCILPFGGFHKSKLSKIFSYLSSYMQFRYLPDANLIHKCNFSFPCWCSSGDVSIRSLHALLSWHAQCACQGILLFRNYIISAAFTEGGEVLLLRRVCINLQTLCVLLGEVGRTHCSGLCCACAWPREAWPQDLSVRGGDFLYHLLAVLWL